MEIMDVFPIDFQIEPPKLDVIKLSELESYKREME